MWRRVRGPLISSGIFFLGLQAFVAVWQLIVQDWWKTEAYPWLAGSTSIEVNRGTAILAPLLVMALLGALATATVIFYRGRRHLAKRVSQLETTLEEEHSQVLDDYAWEFVSITEQWGRTREVVNLDCPVADSPERHSILQRFINQVVWDCARLIQDELVVSGSVALEDLSRPEYLALVHVVGIAEDRKTVRHFYVGNDSTLSNQCGVAGHAFKSQETIIVADIFSDERYAWHSGDTRPKRSVPYASIAATPLVCGDRVVGVFCLDGRAANCLTAERVIPVIEHAARYIAEALDACGPSATLAD